MRLNPSTFIALDVGNRRIGVAVGSLETGLATPREVLDRSQDDCAVFGRVRDLVRQERARTILVGDPLNMDGTAGFQAEAARAFAKRLQGSLRQVRIVLFDERLSSFAADEWMEREGLKPADRKKKRDAYAAAVILLDYFALQKKPTP